LKSLYEGTKQLTAEKNMILSVKVQQGDARAREEMVQGNAGFAYKRAIKYASINRGIPNIDEDDILQASLLGLVEAVDRYDPTTGFSFTTYAHWWILKRITDEVGIRHWTTMRPPRKEMRDFLYKKMNSEEIGEYISKYMSGEPSVLIPKHVQDDGYDWATVMISVNASGLSCDEQRVFDSLYGDNSLGDNLSDLSKAQIANLEAGMLQKIREKM